MRFIIFLILIIAILSCSDEAKKSNPTIISHQTIYPKEQNPKMTIVDFKNTKEGFEDIYELYGINYVKDTVIIDLAYEDYCNSYFYDYKIKDDTLNLLMSAKRYVQIKSNGSTTEITYNSLCNQRVKLKIEDVQSKIRSVSINGESVKMKS